LRCRSFSLLLLALAGSLLLLPLPGLAQPRPSPEAWQEIRALLAEKAARTQAQRKISSRLLDAASLRRGQEPAPGVGGLRTGVDVEPDGAVVVDLDARVSRRLLARIASVGGEVLGSWPRSTSLRARIPLEACEWIAELSEVNGLRPADRAVTHADLSEGVIAHRMDQLRNSHAADGSGIRVGVMSDGVDSLAAVQASGDLPAVTVLPYQAGSGTEGTAMLEVVHDMAPGAELLFATGFNGKSGFAANIRALRDAGAHIIVDDVRYFSEAIFQDGLIAEAVDEVAADGVLYFSAAGNEGNLSNGSSGVWEGDFVDSGMLVEGSPAHAFDVGVTGNLVTVDTPQSFLLQWSDPQGLSANDYDLFLLDSTMSSVVSSSTNTQSGGHNPYELIDSRVVNDAGHYLVVVLDAGEPRYLHLSAFRGEIQLATGGQVAGHSGASGALSVGAVDARLAGGPGGVFAGTESVQGYSSDGPRRVFFRSDGTPYTQSLLSSGGQDRSKPDLAGADCVGTATPGFNTFCGTSAAAPHAAGAAAVLLELAAARGFGKPQVVEAMLGTALDIQAPGVDSNAGHGLFDAFEAGLALLAMPQDLPALGAPSLALLALLLAAAGVLGRRRGVRSARRGARSAPRVLSRRSGAAAARAAGMRCRRR
jgi:subtilisin family serine protease